MGVNRHTAVSFYNRLRTIIAQELTKTSPVSGEIEIDESYFGARRKGKRGRGAAGKVPVFGVLKRGSKVYTTPVPNAKTTTLLPIIRQMIVPDSIVFTDHLPSYNARDVSSFHHVRINHSTTFVPGANHINGIENFWNQAKRHLRRYNGIRKETFPLYLKECEWRFNPCLGVIPRSLLRFRGKTILIPRPLAAGFFIGGTHKQLLQQLKSWVKTQTKESWL